MTTLTELPFSEALIALVEEIQTADKYPFEYALMLGTFYNALEEGETNRMALALARAAMNKEN